jgi:hypothetical protein
MTINVKTAVYGAQTYQELLPVTRELRAGLSSWGYQYATVTAQSSIYQGTIAIGAIAEKAMKIRRSMEINGAKFTPEEKENIVLLSREISRLYGEDKANCQRADRLTTLCRFITSIIFWANHQSKWSNNRNGYREQLQQPLSIRLRTAINKAQNYQDLLAIAKSLSAGLSCWGYQHAYAKTTPPSINKEVIYTGRITIGAMAEKAMKIRERMEQARVGFNSEKRKNVGLVCREISRIYSEDKTNCAEANILTTICRLVMKVILWADHQEKWGDPEDPLDELNRKITTDREILLSTLPGSVYDIPTGFS